MPNNYLLMCVNLFMYHSYYSNDCDGPDMPGHKTFEPDLGQPACL